MEAFEAKEKVASKDVIIGELDGVMAPIVDVPEKIPGVDSRKYRTVRYQEARLAFARADRSRTYYYGATLGDTDTAGEELKKCAQRAGFGENSRIHGLGDGAPWVSDQIEKQFGSSSKFTLDFYHLSEYLSEASICCSDNPKEWLHNNQELMKKNKSSVILNNLKEHCENCEKASCEALKCYNYIIKRTHQVDYESALEEGLPIGSGEIESANRHVMQQRLKIPGAWWKPENAQFMLNLRTTRANGDWRAYWQATSTNSESLAKT